MRRSVFTTPLHPPLCPHHFHLQTTFPFTISKPLPLPPLDHFHHLLNHHQHTAYTTTTAILLYHHHFQHHFHDLQTTSLISTLLSLHQYLHNISSSALHSHRLVGLVVKASASRGFESRFRRDFFGVESYQ